MRINNLRIENFRGFKDETVSLDRYCCFVGANGAGKSTVLAALNVFFRQYGDSKTDLSKLSVEDFRHKNVDQPIRITVTFTDLSEQASKNARQHTLIVSAVARYDPGSQRAEVKQYGSRLGMTEFVEYFEAEKASASARDLQGIYERLARNFGLPPAKVKHVMADNLRAFEASSSKATPIPRQTYHYFPLKYAALGKPGDDARGDVMHCRSDSQLASRDQLLQDGASREQQRRRLSHSVISVPDRRPKSRRTFSPADFADAEMLPNSAAFADASDCVTANDPRP